MFEAIILGIVQGITEFFPISSTAHLILLPWFFDWSKELDNLTFDVALHAGTLFALLICFWRDWIDIILNKPRFLVFIAAASLPAGIAGVLLNDIIETQFRSPLIICISLVLVGIIMLYAEKSRKYKKFDAISLTEAILIGIAQAFALIPGVSRSGITITSGLFMGLQREAAARFSFLLSTPIIAGAALLHAKKIVEGSAVLNLPLVTAGFIASAITGVAAIRFLLVFFRRHPLNFFVYYRFALAVVIMIGIWLKN